MNTNAENPRESRVSAALTPDARGALWASFGGNALDNFDFNLFTFLIPTLMLTWGMRRDMAGVIASSTLFAGAIGGSLAGLLADRYGRVRVLRWTVLWFAFFTFACGFSNSPQQLLILRALQGLGFGGELAVGAVLIGESIAPAVRGRIMSVVASGYALGSIVAALAYWAVFLWLPPERAWRVTFWIGILPALFLLYLRRGVAEPDVFRQSAAQRDGSLSARLRALFSRALALRTLLATLLVIGVTGSQNVFVVWLPTYLRLERGLSVSNTTIGAIANSLGALIGFLFGGVLIDRLGRRNGFRVMALIALAAIIGYLYAPLHGWQFMAAGLFVGVLVVAAGVGTTPFLTELFPTSVRGTALGVCYSCGRGLGSLFVSSVGFTSEHYSLGSAILGTVTATYVLVMLAATLLPETRGRALSAGP